MARRKPNTPRSQVRAALRRLFLRSRERAGALKEASYVCNRCGKKQSKARGREVKVECHHKDGIDWDGVIDLIFERILHPKERLEVLCVKCHKEETERR